LLATISVTKSRVKSVRELSRTITAFKSWIAWEHSLRFKCRATATSEAILKRYNSYNVTHPTSKRLPKLGRLKKRYFSAITLPRGRYDPVIAFSMGKDHAWQLCTRGVQTYFAKKALQLRFVHPIWRNRAIYRVKKRI
jgi:hypothetical protein